MKAENVSKRFQLGQYISLAASLRSLKHITRNPITFLARPSGDGNSRAYGDPQWLQISLGCTQREPGSAARRARGYSRPKRRRQEHPAEAPRRNYATDQGRIWSNARIVPLLGIGAGFDPELTGRENTRLNAAILGFHPAELRERMDAIIDFAEIPEFMDTPMKRYSKGMRARLALAVAFHLSPESSSSMKSWLSVTCTFGRNAWNGFRTCAIGAWPSCSLPIVPSA